MFENLTNPWWVFVILGVCAGIISGGLGIGAADDVGVDLLGQER